MLIVALVLAVIGLAALITAVATSNELIAWVCIGASGLGVLLLIVDAIQDRTRRRDGEQPEIDVTTTEVMAPVAPVAAETTEVIWDDETSSSASDFEEEQPEPEDVPEDLADAEDVPGDEDIAVEDHPEELVYDDPDYDTPGDDEPDFPEPAEEAAVHTVSEDDLAEESYGGEYAEESESGSAAIEVHYAPSAEDSAATVVYTYAEETEIHHVEPIQHAEAGDSEVEDEHRDR